MCGPRRELLRGGEGLDDKDDDLFFFFFFRGQDAVKGVEEGGRCLDVLCVSEQGLRSLLSDGKEGEGKTERNEGRSERMRVTR